MSTSKKILWMVTLVLAGILIGSQLTISRVKAAKAGPVFTYKIRYIPEYPDPEKEMNQYGQDGWELISIGPVEDITEYTDNQGNGRHTVKKRRTVFKKASLSE